MKKIHFLTLLLFCSLKAFCQTEGLYIRLGGNLSSYSNMPQIGFGFQGGLTSIQKINDEVHFNPTLQFSFLNNWDLTSKYFTTIFPVNFITEEVIYLSFGPYASLFYGAKKESRNLGAQIRSFDYGLSPGIGFLISESTSLELRYLHGLTNISLLSEDKRISNRSFQVSVFFLIQEKSSQK